MTAKLKRRDPMRVLLTPNEMARADRLTIEGGVPGIDLMERAGAAIADQVSGHWTPGSKIGLIAGPGNNGGDAFVAARLLAARKYPVRIVLLGDLSRLAGDAALAAGSFTGNVQTGIGDICDWADILVDGIFGAGLMRPIEGAAAAMITAMNDCGKPIVAIDLPSGIAGESGTVRGMAVKATMTVTFFRKKPGHILLPGRVHCGPVTVAQIGIRRSALDIIQPKTRLNRPGGWRDVYRQPEIGGHKYDRGHVVAVSGPMTRTGAARLAAGAALRAGAGLVTMASPPDALAVNAAHLTAIMLERMDGVEGLRQILSDRRKSTIVLGPALGVGGRTRELVAVAIEMARDIVMDADAITSFTGDTQGLASLISDAHQRQNDEHGGERNIVLTPHAGEFARLTGSTSTGDKLADARSLAGDIGATIVLKGADTIVAAPDGRASIADNAPPWLATAGSGDVLAGVIGGMLAQGMPAFEAASAGVYLHGEAGRVAGSGLTAEDLAPALRHAIGPVLHNPE